MGRHELEKHGRRRPSRPRVRRGWDGVWHANLHDVVAEKHHLEQEGDDYVEENDWDDKYPAHARVRLARWSMEYRSG